MTILWKWLLSSFTYTANAENVRRAPFGCRMSVCLMHFSICHSCNVYCQLLSSNVLGSKRATLLSTLCLYGWPIGLIVCPSVSNLLHSVGDCGAFHNEGCNLNFTWCWVLWVQPVCWSFFVGEAGGIIRVPRNWRFFNWIAMSTSLCHGDVKLTPLIFHQICLLGDQIVFPLLSTASDIKFEYSWICLVLQKLLQQQPCCWRNEC